MCNEYRTHIRVIYSREIPDLEIGNLKLQIDLEVSDNICSR